jgi:DNA-directed RNA polymerase subunit F
MFGSRRCASVPAVIRRPSLPISAGFVALAALLFLGTGVASCKGCTSEEAPDGGKSPTALLTDKQAAQVLARVGDRDITLGEFTAALEHMDQFDRLRYQSPERRKELLDEMINVELLADEAVAKGYDKDPLAQQELRSILRDAMLAEARKGAPTPADISASDARAWFDAHRAEYKDPERRRVSVIALGNAAAAADLLARAKKTTAPEWGELVRTRSIDPQARANVPADLAGDLGIVSPPGDARGDNPRVPAPVRAAAFTIADVGGVADAPVTAGDKVYLVRLTQKIPAHERSFEEAERSIRVKLAQDKQREREAALIADLKKKTKVEIDESALATVKVTTPPTLAAAADAGAVVPARDGGR